MTDWPGSQGGYGGPNSPGGWGPSDPTVAASPATWGAAAPPFPPQPFSGGGYPPFGAPPRKSRKPLVFTLVAAVVAVVAVVVGVVVVASGSGKAGTAADAVKGYLEALARGDAEAALSYAADQPASKDFLTDDVLKKQIDKWPITDIRILNDSSAAGIGTVHVAVKFGTQTSDETLSLTQKDGEWKLNQAAIKLDLGHLRSFNDAAMKTLTLFGKPVGKANDLYVFPGWVDFSNSNKNIEMTRTPDTPLLLNGIPGFGIATPLSFNFEISDAGRSATQEALRAFLSNCAQSKQLSPPNCPQRVREPGLVEGTVAWTAPSDISSVTLGYLDAKSLSVRLYGSVKFGISVKTVEGGTKYGTADVFLSGTADLADSPPTISV